MNTKAKAATQDDIEPDPTPVLSLEDRVAILELNARRHGWDLSPPSEPQA